MDIRITDVPDELHRQLRMAAAETGLTLREVCVCALRSGVEFREKMQKEGKDADGRREGSGEAGKVKRGRRSAAVPVLQEAEGAEVGLREVQPVRSELAERGGSGEGPEVKSHKGHLTFKYGEDHYCSTCNEYF